MIHCSGLWKCLRTGNMMKSIITNRIVYPSPGSFTLFSFLLLVPGQVSFLSSHAWFVCVPMYAYMYIHIFSTTNELVSKMRL